MHTLEHRHGSYTVSDDPARLDTASTYSYLTRAYWCEDIPLETVERSLRHSLCIGAYDAHRAQVGLVRIISDFATFAYLCDVYVLDEHRGNGLSKSMMTLTLHHPKLQGLRRWNLITRDAHGLYAQFGFTPLAKPAGYMERLTPDVYKRAVEDADE